MIIINCHRPEEMSHSESSGEESVSRTSSESYKLGFSDSDFDNEWEVLNPETTLNRIMGWFKNHNIEAGDPTFIHDEHMRTNKSKVAILLEHQNKTR